VNGAAIEDAANGARPAPILQVRHLGKRYSIYRNATHRLAQALLGPLLGPLLGRPREFVALEDVSFELQAGDALAVIGRNGAGKSTLLQILAGVMEPSAGSAVSPARIAGLLELGSGFNPEFTGRENIFINSAILGLTRRQTLDRLDPIIAFADIGGSIDQPVKHYSSGMFLRLAFSVAIHGEPQLLLVDEALTVGDIFFRQKCYAKLSELRRQGTTVLLVTHSMADAAEFCNRGLVLSRGRVVFEGSGKEAVDYYFHHESATPTGLPPAQIGVADPPLAMAAAAVEDPAQRQKLDRPETIDLSTVQQFGTPAVRALRLLITDGNDAPRRLFQQGDWLRVYVDFRIDEAIDVPLVGIQLVDSKGVLVHGRNSLQFDADPPPVRAGVTLRCMQEIKLDVAFGPYTLEAGLAAMPRALFERRHLVPPDELASQIQRFCHVGGIAALSVMYRPVGQPCTLSHYGLADLPGRQQLQLLAADLPEPNVPVPAAPHA
jgi:lipopolysaccharide transport system ATP-binding protein